MGGTGLKSAALFEMEVQRDRAAHLPASRCEGRADIGAITLVWRWFPTPVRPDPIDRLVQRIREPSQHPAYADRSAMPLLKESGPELDVAGRGNAPTRCIGWPSPRMFLLLRIEARHSALKGGNLRIFGSDLHPDPTATSRETPTTVSPEFDLDQIKTASKDSIFRPTECVSNI